MPVYFDYAAATPLDARVLTAMRPYLTELFYNPSASYLVAQQVARDVAKARADVARWLGARGSEIIFTAGGTEANNLAIHGIMRQFPDSNMVVSAIEHESVLAPAAAYNRRVAPVLADGRIDMHELEALIDDQTVLVSIMQANNEIGTVQPIREIARLVQKVRKSRSSLPLYFHTDSCQAANYLDLHVARLGVDLLSLNAGKIYGPKQCGALYVHGGIQLQPQITGGGQERNLRSGSENVANIVGLAAALDLAQNQRQVESNRLHQLQQLFFQLVRARIPRAIVNGSIKYRLPNNVHLTLSGYDNERIVMELDERGIQCAAGSACNASKSATSQVLTAIGVDEINARFSVRFTMGRGTDETAVRRTVAALVELRV